MRSSCWFEPVQRLWLTGFYPIITSTKKTCWGGGGAFRWFNKEHVDSPASCWWGRLAAQEGRLWLVRSWEVTSPHWLSGHTLQEPNEGACMQRKACRVRCWCQWETTELFNLVTLGMCKLHVFSFWFCLTRFWDENTTLETVLEKVQIYSLWLNPTSN